MARPSKICEDHIKYLDAYVDECWDEWEQLEKSSSSSEKWSSESYENKLLVNLPTYAWYLVYLKKQDKKLRIGKSTLFDWINKSKEEDSDEIFVRFSDSLEDLLILQEEMLINWGVASKYWQVVTKLMLSSNHWYKETEKKEVEHSWSVNLSDFFDWTKKDTLVKK